MVSLSFSVGVYRESYRPSPSLPWNQIGDHVFSGQRNPIGRLALHL